MKLSGIVITCNYPDDECQAAVPSEMTVMQLCQMVQKLCVEERDMTSFQVVAAISQAKD